MPWQDTSLRALECRAEAAWAAVGKVTNVIVATEAVRERPRRRIIVRVIELIWTH